MTLCNETYGHKIGESCVFLGFPLNTNYLTIHSAIISIKYATGNDIKYIQIDGSVNKGNSGGPLINSTTGDVIGYITLKKTGFTDKFSKLRKSFKDNIDYIDKNPGANMVMGGIDLRQSLKAIQQQLNLLGNEIERSANVGIGIAFELDQIRKGIK